MTHHRFPDGHPSPRLIELLEISPDKYRGVGTYDYVLMNAFLRILTQEQFDKLKLLVSQDVSNSKQAGVQPTYIFNLCSAFRRTEQISFTGL